MKKIFLNTSLLLLLSATSFISCKNGTAEAGSKNSLSSASGDAIELKFNIPNGSKFMYSTSLKQKVQMMGQNMTMNMVMDYLYNITGAENNNKNLSVSYDRIQMEMDAPGMGLTKYDSKDETAKDPSGGAFKNMVGKAFTMTVSPDGEIVNIDGLKDILPTGAAGFDENTMKQTMQMSFNFYPDKPVKPGESWNKKTTMNIQVLTMSIDSKYTLKEVKGDNAIVSVDSKITMDPGTSSEMQGMKMDMSGTQSGTMEVEIKTGQLLSGNLTQKISGKISAGGQEMPMDTNSDIVITGKKL